MVANIGIMMLIIAILALVVVNALAEISLGDFSQSL